MNARRNTSNHRMPVAREESSWVHRFLFLAVFVDMFAISLVVPMLPIRLKELGAQASTISFIGSVYAAAQMIGGLAMGLLADKWLGRRSVLIIAFMGASLSCALLGMARSVGMVLLSRLIVGLVKHTVTVSTAMAAEWSTTKGRSNAIGNVSTAAMLASLSGSALSAYMVTNISPYAPVMLAVSLYGVDVLLVMATVPNKGLSGMMHSAHADDRNNSKQKTPSSAKGSQLRSYLRSFKRPFANSAVARVLMVKIAYELVARAGKSMQRSWEQDRFNLTLETRGVLEMVRSGVGVIVSLGVGNLIDGTGEERAVCLAMALLVVASVCDVTSESLYTYTITSVPLSLLGHGLAELVLESLFTQVVPHSDLSHALAVVDGLASGCGVAGPLLGGFMLEYGGLVWSLSSLAGSAYVMLFIACANGALPFPRSTTKEATFEQHQQQQQLSQHSSGGGGGGATRQQMI